MSFPHKLVGCCLGFMLAATGSLQGQEKSPQEIEKSCRQAVQRFYNQVVGKGPKTPRAVLSPELRRQLKDDEDNKMDDNGYIVGLDWDPIAYGQDYFERYEAGKVTRKGNRYLVEITCLWDNKKSPNKMRHEVMFNRGRWMIMNIHYYDYEQGTPPQHTDLLSILQEVRKERRKKSK